MKLPRFSLREVLMLTTIVALAIPYIYNAFQEPSAFDFSFSDIQSIIQAAEPKARLLRDGGDSEFSDMTYLMPPSSSADFVKKVHEQIEQHISANGWTVHGSGKTSENGEMTQFSYKVFKGKTQCRFRLVKIHYKQESEFDNGTGLQEIRLLLFVDQSETL